MGATFAFAASVQPGPFLTYIISQTLERGWKHTLPAVLAPVLSDGPIIVVVLLVLTQIPTWFVPLLHFGGALLLFYLTYGAFKSWKNYDAEKVIHQHGSGQTLFKAVMVNLLNPNPYLAWSLVMGPLLIQGYNESPANGVTLIAGFYSTFTICLVTIIFLFAFARNLGPRVNLVMIGLSVAALGLFGLYQLWLGLSAL